ncbi:MAG: nucleotidyltransferase domain-containing protein [Methanobacteriota archaeon]
MNKFDLISYGMDFCSFLLRSDVGNRIDKVILFGSVVRGDFDEESDVDIFVDTKYKIEKEVEKVLKSFEVSDINEKWRLKGVKNPLSVKVGNLEKWKLRRSVISDGIVLYGKYKEMPENVKYYLLLSLNFKGLNRNKQLSVWRRLYGYRQKIGSKTYVSKGLIGEINGKKIDRGVIVVPSENKDKIIDFLKENKIKHKIDEVWSDTL